MLKRTKLQAFLVLAAGALLGFAAASGRWRVGDAADAATHDARSANSHALKSRTAVADCCSEGATKGTLLAQGDTKKEAAPQTAPPGSPAATTTIDGRYLPNPPAKLAAR